MIEPLVMAAGQQWLLHDLVVAWQVQPVSTSSSKRNADRISPSWSKSTDFPEPGTHGHHLGSPNGCSGCL